MVALNQTYSITDWDLPLEQTVAYYRPVVCDVFRLSEHIEKVNYLKPTPATYPAAIKTNYVSACRSMEVLEQVFSRHALAEGWFENSPVACKTIPFNH